MAIMRLDPFGEALGMQKEVEKLLGRLDLGRFGNGSSIDIAWMPKIDVKTDDKNMIVYAEIPGMNRDEIDVEVIDGDLVIKGERKTSTEKTEEGWLIRERSYGSFERALALPEGVEIDKITADYKDGVLEVCVPKVADTLKSKSHRIPLGTGEMSNEMMSDTSSEEA